MDLNLVYKLTLTLKTNFSLQSRESETTLCQVSINEQGCMSFQVCMRM